MISFVATAVIVVLMLIHYYVSVFDPAQDPYDKIDGTTTLDFKPNPIDVVFLKSIRNASANVTGYPTKAPPKHGPSYFEKVSYFS
jgi:hypothetical protein